MSKASRCARFVSSRAWRPVLFSYTVSKRARTIRPANQRFAVTPTPKTPIAYADRHIASSLKPASGWTVTWTSDAQGSWLGRIRQRVAVIARATAILGGRGKTCPSARPQSPHRTRPDVRHWQSQQLFLLCYAAIMKVIRPWIYKQELFNGPANAFIVASDQVFAAFAAVMICTVAIGLLAINQISSIKDGASVIGSNADGITQIANTMRNVREL
jgi:hypothetical protein